MAGSISVSKNSNVIGYLFLYSSIYLLTCLFSYLPICSCIYSFSYLFMLPFNFLLIVLSIYLFIYLLITLFEVNRNR